jgi:phenylacetate-CoA ligase
MFDMGTIVRNQVIPTIYKLINSFNHEYKDSLIKTERYWHAGRAEVHSAVNLHLEQYLKYCLKYSPFWQQHWPNDLRHFDRDDAIHILNRLPILSKEDIRLYGKDLQIPQDVRDRNDGFPVTGAQFKNYSGGSTGVPTEVWQDQRLKARNRAIVDFAYRSAGIEPGEAAFYLWGSANELNDLKSGWRKRSSTWLRGLIPLPAFGLNEAKVRQYAKIINDNRNIKSAICFVSALDTFLGFIEKFRIPLRRISRIVTGGGKLHSALRERAKAIWADDIYEIYGGRDSTMLGVESSDHQGILLFPWHTYIEVLNNRKHVKEGERGEIHVTCLNNYSFAMIRLALGDMAIYRDKPNTWNRARIEAVIGRTAECLVALDGTFIDPSAVIHLVGVVEKKDWIRKFQVVQERYEKLVLKIEPWDMPAKKELLAYENNIGNAFKSLFGSSMVLEIEFVDVIPPLASGKHTYCVGIQEKDIEGEQ